MVNVHRLPDKLCCQIYGNLHWGILKKNHKLKSDKYGDITLRNTLG